MPNWSGSTVWKKHSGYLATAEEDEFERRLLPFLRLRWPLIVQAPRKRHWDARGIDLFVWSDSGALPIVVQAKGFKVRELGADQLRQVEESIDKFEKSDVQADMYLLVHNRDSRSEDFRRRVATRMERLVVSGR